MIVPDVVEILSHCLAEIKNVFGVATGGSDCIVDLDCDFFEIVIAVPRRVLLVSDVDDRRFWLRLVHGVKSRLVSAVSIFFSMIEMSQNF